MKAYLALASVLALAALAATGCAPEIGDECETSVNCDVNGTRICDLAQPGGYCTVEGCESGTCPPGSVCVEFEPSPARLARTWCMAECEADGDCRDSEGYGCRLASEIGGTPDAPLARIVDEGRGGQRFCTVVPSGS